MIGSSYPLRAEPVSCPPYSASLNCCVSGAELDQTLSPASPIPACCFPSPARPSPPHAARGELSLPHIDPFPGFSVTSLGVFPERQSTNPTPASFTVFSVNCHHRREGPTCVHLPPCYCESHGGRGLVCLHWSGPLALHVSETQFQPP